MYQKNLKAKMERERKVPYWERNEKYSMCREASLKSSESRDKINLPKFRSTAWQSIIVCVYFTACNTNATHV